jgi:type I restriction enzyme S subunit
MREHGTLLPPVEALQRMAQSRAGGVAPPYAAYRESGIPWLGRQPTHWQIEKLKYIARAQFSNVNKKTEEGEQQVRLCNYVDVYYHDRITADIEFMEATAEPREIAKFQLQMGDVLITKDSEDPNDICVPAVVAEPLPGVLCGYHLAQVRPDPDRTHGPYLMYAFRSSGIRDQFRMRANGITRFGLSQDDICSALFPLPPLPEQQAIAGWLDERTRRIDDLVAANRRLLGLLAEQRTALITHAVTKGVSPAAPMKPSGIDWLGSVPAHWEVKRIKFIARVGNGSTPSRENPEYWSGDYPWLNSGVVNQREVTEASDFVTDLALAECHLPIVRPPAVLVGITGEGKTRGMATVLRIEATINQHLSFVKPTRADCDTEYMRFTLHAAYQFLRDESGGGGSTKGAITCDQLGNVSIPFPPHPEQRAIVARIDAACAKLDALAATTETAIARLSEYRQALISAAVTGKINVCGAAVSARSDDALAADPAPAIAGRIGKNGAARTANKHFQRSVLAAEIIARIGQHPTFGRVKLQKALILAEGQLQLAEIESQPVRAAAGPFDNAMMRSIQSQLQKSQWYEYKKDGTPLKFAALAKVGGHKQYFDRYWGAKEAAFAALMAVLARLTTRQAEIVATLYSAWNDFLIDNKPVTDDALVAEVLTNWDPAKTAIPEAKWRAALPWMGSRGLVPKGYGAHTRRTNSDRSKE